MDKPSYGNQPQVIKDSLIHHEVLNGHGPTDSPFLLWFLEVTRPEWLRPEAAYHHDFNYIRGGNECDRYKADFDYYLIMLQDAVNDYPNDFIFFWRWLRCWVHFKAVRYGGRKKGRFRYAQEGEPHYLSIKEILALRFVS